MKVLKRIPKGMRQGQVIFNFLAWIKEQILKEKHKVKDTTVCLRMADPFYIEDKYLDILYE